MASILKVDKIRGTGLDSDSLSIDASGNLSTIKTFSAPGATIQTQFTQYASKVTQSYSADTATAITGMTVNITPKFANSAIKLVGTWGGEIADNGLWDHVFFFYRDSTQIPPSSDFPGYSSKPNQPFGLGCAGETYYAGADNSSTPNYVNIQYYDFPNTTSQITYKLGIRFNSGGTLYINHTVGDLNAGDYERFMSQITATEIAQ